MKTVSGLTSKHLRFDVSAYISQINKARTNSDEDINTNTHPSILIRSRALLWFSLSSYFHKNNSSVVQNELEKMDARIKLDLKRFVDGAIHKRVEEAKKDLFMWRVIFELIQSGKFKESHYIAMSVDFGPDVTDRIRSFLTNLEPNEIDSIVFEKVLDTRSKLDSLIPSTFMAEVEILEKNISKRVAEILN
jgi:hypothetical protein